MHDLCLHYFILKYKILVDKDALFEQYAVVLWFENNPVLIDFFIFTITI